MEKEEERDEEAILEELEEISYQSRQPKSAGQKYALSMAEEAARLFGATEKEIADARRGKIKKSW